MTKVNFWLKFAFLTGVTFLLYANTLHGEFHLDDVPFIVKNPTIRDITNLPLIGKSILGEHARHVVFFSFALNYYLNKLDVVGYHVFNILFHLLTGIGIWQFTRLLFMTPRFNKDVGPDEREGIAFFAALLFICHPANTQAVAYITQRFASMATMFYVGTLAFYLKARLTQEIGRSTPYYLLAGASALMGMLSKELVITLPIMAFAIDYFCISSPLASDRFEKSRKKLIIKPSKNIPWVTILVMIGLLLIVPFLFKFNVKAIFNIRIPSSSHEGDILTFNSFLMTQLRVIAVLLRLLVLPYGQTLDYDFPMSTGLFTPWTTLLSLMAIMGLIACAIVFFRRYFLASFAIIWFFLTYLPEFYPRTHVIFEHKLYLTSIGFFIAFSAFLFTWPRSRTNAVRIMACLCIILGIVTVARNTVWRTEQTLWEDAVKKSPNKYRTNLNLGNVYQLQGLYDKSIPYYNRALTSNPYGYKAYNSRAVAYYMKGNRSQAIEDLDRAIKSNPLYDDPYNNRGNLRREQGDLQGAISDYTQAIKISQFAPIAYKNRADAYGQLGDLDNAVRDYRTAIKMDPKLRDAYNNMGSLLKRHKKFNEALALYDEALGGHPANAAEYLVGKGNIYTDMGRLPEAARNFEDAIRINPHQTEALFNAGVVYANMGNTAKAEDFYSQAIRVMPSLAVAYNNRGDIRLKQQRYPEALDDFTRADQLSPKNPIILRNLIHTWTALGNPEKARQILEESVAAGVTLDKPTPDQARTIPPNTTPTVHP